MNAHKLTVECPRAEDESNLCPQAQAIADEAVERVFGIFGVDVHEARDVDEFRQNLWFAAQMRKTANHVLMTVLGLFLAAIVAALMSGMLKVVGK